MFLRFCLLFCLFTLDARGQLTLVESAPNDSFDLSQTRFALRVTDFAVTRGQFSLPMNLQKPVATNLLHWRYFDNISGENVVTRHEPTWVDARAQLLNTVPDSMMLSLHINLECADTTLAERKHQIFMVIGGLTKADLTEMPLTAFFEVDTYAPRRFAAIVQLALADGQTETFDCIEGTCTIERFDAKAGTLGGTFEFTANRIGRKKHGFFRNGVFTK